MAKKLSDENFIFDNVVLSNFARAEIVDLIFKISRSVFTTREVLEEIHRGVDKKPKLASILSLVEEERLCVQSVGSESGFLLMAELQQGGRLGLGEISAMTLAKEIGGIFLTDDKLAKKTAQSNEIGILLPKDHGLIIPASQEYKDTAILLQLMLGNKVITKEEFERIRVVLATENFIF